LLFLFHSRVDHPRLLRPGDFDLNVVELLRHSQIAVDHDDYLSELRVILRTRCDQG
jgi:hypothetical protein